MNKIVFILVGMLIASLALSGCAAPAPAPTPAPAPAPTPAPAPAPARAGWPDIISIGAGPVGGVAYPIGVGLSQLFTKHMGITANPEVTAGVGGIMSLMKKKQAEMGFTMAYDDYNGIRGTDAYEAMGKVPLRNFIYTHSGDYQLVALKASGIKRPEDFRDKKIMYVSKTFTTCVRSTAAVCEAYGLEADVDFKALPMSSLKENVTALREGRADVIIHPGKVPIPGLVELATMVDIQHITISEEMGNKIHEKYPWMGWRTVPAGGYKGQDYPFNVIIIPAHYQVREDLPDDLVYELLKTIDENIEELRPVHPMIKAWNLKYFLQNAVIPFHAGAIRYYKEKGVWTEDMERLQQKLLAELGLSK